MPQLLSLPCESEAAADLNGAEPPADGPAEADLFARLLRPTRLTLREGLRELRAGHACVPFEPATAEDILVGHIARQVHARLDAPGDVRAILDERPELVWLVSGLIDAAAASGLELMGRLCVDWPLLVRTFFQGRDPGPLTGLEGGPADALRGDRSAVELCFGEARLVYRPWWSAADVHFQGLLSWLNERGARPGFRTVTVLDRGGYGWSESVAPHGCTFTAEVRRYFERLGGCLAVLHLLGATDFPAGGVAADGEYPVVTELGALFDRPPAGAAEDPAVAGLRESVAAVGLAVDQCRPRLRGVVVNAADFEADLVAGLTSTYRLLEERRQELLGGSGPLAAFADDVVCVRRPDGLEDDEADDVLYTTRPGSRDLWASSGERLGSFFERTGLEALRERLSRRGRDDREKQTWLLRAAVGITSTPGARQEPAAKRRPARPAQKDELITAAQAIGDRLQTLAWLSDGEAGWAGLVPGKRGWAVAPLGVDLAEGLSGVVLFLAYLGSVTGEPRYTALAEAGLEGLRRRLRRPAESVTSVGGFDGWGGPLYALSHLAVLWAEPALLAEAEDLAVTLPGLVERDEALGLERGAAGCLMALLSVYRCSGSRRTLAQAMKCGDHLLDALAGRLVGGGPVVTAATLSMAGPLLELAQATYAERFRSAAESLLACRRSGRLPVDLLGHGRSLLQALPQVEEPLLGEVNALLEALAVGDPADDHSLGRGEVGVIDLFLEAAETTGRARWRNEARVRAAAVLASVREGGWVCDTPGGVETPGLLRGLAGVGYGLLRLANPGLVPSVLAMAPPQTL